MAKKRTGRVRTALVVAVSVNVLCPYCGEPQPSRDGSEQWMDADFGDEPPLLRECVSCDKPMRVFQQSRALAAPPPDPPGLDENKALRRERDEAMRVLSPSMPESGLVDACRQVKQAAISAIENGEQGDKIIAALRAELAARQSAPPGLVVINEDDGDVCIDFDWANDRTVSIRLGADSCGLSALIGRESFALPLDKVPPQVLALLRTEAKRTTIHQSAPPGLVALVQEWADASEAFNSGSDWSMCGREAERGRLYAAEERLLAAILPASPQAQKTPHPLDWCDGSGAQCDGCPACKPPQAEMMPTEGGQ